MMHKLTFSCSSPGSTGDVLGSNKRCTSVSSWEKKKFEAKGKEMRDDKRAEANSGECTRGEERRREDKLNV